MYEAHFKFFDVNGFMPPYGENGVLFTAEYIFLRRVLNVSTLELSSVVMESIDVTLAPSDRDKLSHDNMTAIICLSKFYGFDYHKHYFHREWWHRAHPKDIGFTLYNMNLFTRVLSIPFMVVLIADMLLECFKTTRVNNGDLDTDGKLLAWLRCQAMGWNTLQKVCEYLLRKRNNASWNDIFMIYFRKDTNNPIVELANKAYGS